MARTKYHVVLLDNGRTGMLGNEFRPMLRCIRCGACMNHCPVYSAIGGHAYGWVYPGPMGKVLTPMFRGLDGTVDLPNACTLNGRCASVCPVKIPLPDLIRRLRDWQFDAGLGSCSTSGRPGLQAWARVARHPRLYHGLTRLGTRALRLVGGQGSARRLPLAGLDGQPRPAAARRCTSTFQAAWRRAGRSRRHDRRGGSNDRDHSPCPRPRQCPRSRGSGARALLDDGAIGTTAGLGGE
ncbi:MAG: 4Fe-4S dicluster domain-containing protein [Arhodomonas sp.]|nr:4Fe-4S dicluster domain-containing protein [Arhodomonas sp.]